MSTFALTTCLAVVLNQTPVDQKPKESPPQPKLLVKEAAYFLHAVPTKGLAIVHTTRSTGEMNLLASGHYSSLVLPSLTDGSNQPVVAIHEVRIAGVAADKERIYVLHWDGSATGLHFHTTTYRLLVFGAQDGKLICQIGVERRRRAKGGAEHHGREWTDPAAGQRGNVLRHEVRVQRDRPDQAVA